MPVRARRPLVLGALALLGLLLTQPGQAATKTGGLPVLSIHVFPGAGGEPNVAVAPGGRTVLVDGLARNYVDPANLFRSADGGASFARVTGFVPKAGGGDWDMHFLSDKVVIACDLGTRDVMVDVSEDAGRTWRQTTLQGDPQLDRPWITGQGDDVYVTMKGFDGIPYLYVSHDLGRTFTAIPILTYGADPAGTGPDPVQGYVTNQNAYVDAMTLDRRTGRVYILYGIDGPNTYPSSPPLGAPNRLYLAHLDPGASPRVLTSSTVYTGTPTDAFYAGFNWLAVDSHGTVYVVANGRHDRHQSAWLTSSTDHGATFGALTDIGTPHVASVYTAIAAARPGALVLAYYEGTLTDASATQRWFATTAVVSGADGPHPVVSRRQHVLSQPVHTRDICLDGIACGLPGFGKDRNLLDYVDVAVGPDGTAWASYASDGPATGGGAVATVLTRVRLLR